MQRGSEVIMAQKTSHVSVFVFMRCCYVLCLLPSSNTLVTLPRYRMRPTTFIQCTHIDQGPTLYKALCRVDVWRPWEEWDTACLHAPAWVCLAPSAWPFCCLTWRQVYSLFSWLFSSCVDAFCRDAFEHVLDDVVWRNLIRPALRSPPSHLFFSLRLSY